MPRQERDIRGYSIPQYRKKNWQIRNTVSKIDEVPIPHFWSVTLYPSPFACIHQHSTSSQPSRENVRRSRIKRYNDRKARLLDVAPISRSKSNCPKLCIHWLLSLKSSKYWPRLDMRGQMNGTAIPWRTAFFYRISLPRRMKNCIPQGWIILQLTAH